MESGFGFVARPVEGRKGRFKKASNMNYCLDVALRVEHVMRMFNVSIH